MPKGYPSPRQRNCARCGSEFTATANAAKFCSDECRVLVRRSYNHGEPMPPSRRRCGCGAEISGPGAWKNCAACRPPRELRGRHPHVSVPCKHCGTMFSHAQRSKVYCCMECQVLAKRERWAGITVYRTSEQANNLRRANRRTGARRRLATAARGRTTNRVWTNGPCRECGEMFMATAGARPAAFCSDKCQRRWKFRKNTQRTKKRKAAKRLALFQRDGWICQICGDPIDPTLHHLDWGAPELDHIIPRACGGSDDDSNLQAAHRYCNHVKSAQVGFEFAA